MGGQKSLGDIRILKGYCQVEVQTDGYLEMQDYHDLKNGRHIYVSSIPVRSYRNKLVMKVVFPGASERIRYTMALMLMSFPHNLSGCISIYLCGDSIQYGK